MIKNLTSRNHWLNLFLIAAVVVAVFWPVLHSGFVNWDDEVHILNNVGLRSLDGEHLKNIFTSRVNNIYIPLTSLSFAVEYHFFGYNSFIFHLTNLLLHLLIVGLIYYLALRLRLGTLGAGLAALLFGIHPMHVESVAWVTERKDVLYASFYLFAVLSYLDYLDKKRLGSLVLTYVFGILSMLAKPMALSLPFILFLIDWFRGRGINQKTVLEKLPLGLLIVGIAAVTYVTQARNPISNPLQSLLIWPWTLAFYIRQFFVPLHLVPIYRLPYPISLLNPQYFLSIILVVGLVWSFWRFKKDHRWFAFAVGYFFLSIFFLLRFDEAKDTNIVADRFMYLPSLGVCLWVGAVAEKWWHSPKKNLVLAVILGAGLILAVKSFQQVTIWKNSENLWAHQLKYFPNEHLALNNLANVLRDRSDFKSAEKVYKKTMDSILTQDLQNVDDSTRESIKKVDYVISLYTQAGQIAPDFEEAFYNLGKIYHDLGRFEQAEKYYSQAAGIDPKSRDALFGLAVLSLDRGQYAASLGFFDKLLNLEPANQDVYSQIILALHKHAQKDPALVVSVAVANYTAKFAQLVKASPKSAIGLFNLGYVYQEIGENDLARECYLRVLELRPDYFNALYNLGNLYKTMGRWEEAAEFYRKSISISSWHIDSYVNLASVLASQGKSKEAVDVYKKALLIDPKNAKIHFNLGYFYEKNKDYAKASEAYQKSLKFDDANADAFYNLGNVYASLGERKNAISAYVRTVNIKSDHLDAWINASIMSFRDGDFANSYRYLKEAMTLGYQPPAEFLKVLKEKLSP